MLSFDIILLDWHLSDINGIDVLRKYRAGGGNAPVLMLTGSTTLAEKEEALSSGANSYMSKPFKLKELSDNLIELLAGNRSNRN
jgi:two-component system response regulator AtoC